MEVRFGRRAARHGGVRAAKNENYKQKALEQQDTTDTTAIRSSKPNKNCCLI